jgi:para-nitrobenzyl esterase
MLILPISKGGIVAYTGGVGYAQEGDIMKALSLIAAALALAGCTAMPGQGGLAGTSWQLVSFQPSDGTAEIRPTSADQYTLAFGSDGKVAARVDCNRGTGAWSTSESNLTIGPLATTRMMCLQPQPMSSRLPADFEKIRSYRLANGKLQLQADSGTYQWEPVSRAPVSGY